MHRRSNAAGLLPQAATIRQVTWTQADAQHAGPPERAAVVGLAFGARSRRVVESSLEELTGLAVTAGASVAFRAVQELRNPSPALFLGRGKAAELAADCEASAIDLVIVDEELTPVQLRNLDAALPCRVVDRTQLILDIFASRARTREGRLQVELAQLKYLLPRLTGAGVALSRLGAGIGTRGPGETKLESDRRRIRHRITRLTRELDAVRRRRARSRGRRQKDAVPTVALVGYTNAGKTSLFNRLTRSDALASSKLFATLDPLVRPLRLPDRQTVLLSDTVGFIDRLPHTLVAAFRATLEEVAEADLLLHVIDASHADREARTAAVHRVLEEVGCEGLPQLQVFNKCDRVAEADLARLDRTAGDSVCISARTGLGTDELVRRLMRLVEMDTSRVTLEFDHTTHDDRERLAALHRHSRVLRQVTEGDRVSVEADVPRRLIARLRPRNTAASVAEREKAVRL